jgi:hypothetical protein
MSVYGPHGETVNRRGAFRNPNLTTAGGGTCRCDELARRLAAILWRLFSFARPRVRKDNGPMAIRFWFFAALAVFAMNLTAQIPSVPTYRFSGWLRTSGTNLLDSRNHPVRLLSVNQSGAEWGAGSPFGATTGWNKQFGGYAFPSNSTEYVRLDNWGFNSVRLLISWANLEPTPPTLDGGGNLVHHWNEDYVTNLDATVEQFANHHLSVILSLHQWTFSPVFTNEAQQIHGLGMPVWLYFDTNSGTYLTIGTFQLDGGPHSKATAEDYFFGDAETNALAGIRPVILPDYPSQTGTNGYNVQDGFIDAWKFIAARYSNNPAVIGADLYNEPPNNTAIHLKRFYNTVGSNVYSVNPNLLLICQDSGSEPTNLFGVLASAGRPGLSNLVYSIHFYVSDWQDLTDPNGNLVSYQAQTYLTNYQATSVSWNVPFWVGEFDEFLTNHAFNSGDMAQMMRFCRSNAIN